MSSFSRPLPSHLRGQSMGASQQSTFLQQKIADKKTELANLKDLQALSGGLADQMQMLADKLQTLSDGTEGMFCRYELPTNRIHIDQGCNYMLTLTQLLQQYYPTGTMYFVLSTWRPVSSTRIEDLHCII